MNGNKNQLREDAIEFAIQVSDLCDEIKGCSVYINQIIRSSSSIGDFLEKVFGNGILA